MEHRRQVPLRIAEALHLQIKTAASQSGRSMNAEVKARLEKSFSDEALREWLQRVEHKLDDLAATIRKKEDL